MKFMDFMWSLGVWDFDLLQDEDGKVVWSLALVMRESVFF